MFLDLLMLLNSRSKKPVEDFVGRGPPIAAVEVLVMLVRLVRFVQLGPEAAVVEHDAARVMSARARDVHLEAERYNFAEGGKRQRWSMHQG